LLAGAGLTHWVLMPAEGPELKLQWLRGITFLLGLSSLLAAGWLPGWRPLIWLTLFVMLLLGTYSQTFFAEDGHIGLCGPWVLLLFIFEPRWIKPRGISESETLFYDGECGLCHRAVRFLLSEDVGGAAFNLSPLQGPTFSSMVSAEDRAQLPDSIIVRRQDGELLSESSAIAHMLQALGGYWRLVGFLMRCVPLPIRDLVYRFVARVRKRIFAQPKQLCPLLPPHLGSRFLP
jgi:predicted DCC family thiol-disulfide oxidoreductase YuxK